MKIRLWSFGWWSLGCFSFGIGMVTYDVISVFIGLFLMILIGILEKYNPEKEKK